MSRRRLFVRLTFLIVHPLTIFKIYLRILCLICHHIVLLSKKIKNDLDYQNRDTKTKILWYERNSLLTYVVQ
jgi:hypothetical protein